MKLLARLFGKRMTSDNEYCYAEAYFWLGRLYYWRFETVTPPLSPAQPLKDHP